MSIQIVEIAQPSVIDTVAVAQPSTVALVEIRQGPAGTGGGGSASWGGITGTLSAQTDLQTALNLKAPLASPALTGTPTAPTAVTTTSTTQVATTAFVQQELASGTATAKNVEVFVRNVTGATITKGSIVYINGASGNRPTITKAQANNDANSAQTIGFVKADISNNGTGYVITSGDLENVNTNGIGVGVQLYLSPTTAGTWTTTKPSAPNHLVYVGIVVVDHPTQGIIYVAIQNGYELNELHDVAISSPAAKQVIKRNAGNTLWVNEAIVSADVSDATSAATANTLVLRDGSGDAAFAGVTFSGLLDAGDFSVNGTTGEVVFGSGSQILFDGISYSYGTGAAEAHRIALGAGTTGSELFQAATPAAANQTLGMVSGTAKGTTAASGVTSNVITLSIPSAGFWRIEAFTTWINASSSSTLMSLLFDSAAVVPATNFRIGQTMVNATVAALNVLSPALTASIGATSSTASAYINSTASGLIETTGASTLILRVQNTAGAGTSTVTQASLSATKL
jgi:hypothetical protein